MRNLLICVPLLLAAGCAPTVSGANERGGIVEHVVGLNRAEAMKEADAHCAQFKRVAKVTEQNTLASTLVFECVER